MIRFNEAIDQALAESIGFFSAHVDQAGNLLLGMLGHDMRSPLQTAMYLAALNAGEKVSEAAARLVNSGARMQALLDDLDDLVEFNRTKLTPALRPLPCARQPPRTGRCRTTLNNLSRSADGR